MDDEWCGCPTCERFPVHLRGPDDVAGFGRAIVTDGTASAPALVVIALDDWGWTSAIGVDDFATTHLDASHHTFWRIANRYDDARLVALELRAGPQRVPDRWEVDAFWELARECAPDAVVIDCIVVTDHHWWSFRELAADDGGLSGPGRGR